VTGVHKEVMMRQISVFAIFVAIAFGCGHADKTNDPSLHFVPLAKSKWQLQTPVAIQKIDRELKGYICSDEYEEAFRQGKADRSAFGLQFPITAVLPKGTTISIESLINRGGDIGGYYVEFSVVGDNIAEKVEAPDEFFMPNDFLSPNMSFPRTWKINDKVLGPLILK
jgi:hypothetical protein